MAVDCDCGTTVEACDEEELFDELLEHIAAAHETAFRATGRLDNGGQRCPTLTSAQSTSRRI